MLSYLLMLIILAANDHGHSDVQADDPIPDFLPEKLVKLFESRTYQSPGNVSGAALAYQFFVPVIDSNEQQTFPLILFFHGHGLHEMDFARGQLLYLDKLIFRDLERRERYPFFLLAPQCPRERDNRWVKWHGECVATEEAALAIEPIEVAIRILDKVCAEYPVDRDRIYLCGISSGGSACWELALRYPRRFAAVVPLASSGAVRRNLEDIKNVPIWAFHSEGDHPEAVQQTISTLRALGGICHLTETLGEEHDCWSSAFQDYDLLDWILAQKRHSQQNGLLIRWQLFRLEYLRWTYLWPRLIAVTAIASILWLCEAELRRRST